MKKTTLFLTALSVLVVLTTSCKKKTYDIPTPTIPPFSVNSSPLIKFNVDGTTFAYGDHYVQGYVGSSGSGGVNGGMGSKIYSSALTDPNGNIVYFNVDKGTCFFLGGPYADATSFKNFFPVGSVAFSTGAINGVELGYTDSAGNTWTTGTGPQTGSTFTIDEVKEEYVLGSQSIKIKASFSCKFYDANGQNPKTATNGTYVGYFENI